MVQVRLNSGYNDGSGLKLAGDIVFVEKNTATFMLKEGLASLCETIFQEASPKAPEEDPPYQDDQKKQEGEEPEEVYIEEAHIDEAPPPLEEIEPKGKKRA